MTDIEKDMDKVAESMEKSVQDKEFSKEMLQETIFRLGPEGLRKALPRLNDVQKAMLSEVLEDMKKSHKQLVAKDKANTTEPEVNSTPSGDYLFNEDVKPPFTEHDETLNEEARKRQQMVHRNQGGGAPVEGWEGQVIKSKDVKEPEEKTEQKKAEDKAELDSHKKKTPSEKKFESELTKAGEEAFGTDGDRMMKCEHGAMAKSCGKCKEGEKLAKKQGVPEGVDPKKHEDCVKEVKAEGHDKSSAFAICNASMKKAEEMNVEDKKKAAKTNLPKVMARMQERKMEKSVCVAQLAKSLNVEESKIEKIWDLLAKGSSENQGPKTDGFKYDDGKTGTAPSEATEQSRVPDQMKKGEEAGVHDKEEPSVPSYKDKSAKKPEGAKKPESGKATETADATISKVPETMGHKGDMKKGFWHEEDEVYLAKSAENPFARRTTGQNVAYKVDEYVEAEHNSHKERLSKSTFDYETDEEALSKGGAGSGRHKEKFNTGPIPYKNRDKQQGNLLAQAEMEKADPEAEAQAQAQEVNRQAAQNAKEEKENQRQAKVDEQLTRIEERAGPKIAPQLRKDFDGSNAAEGMMKMKKSWVNDLLEKGLDLGDDQVYTAQQNRASAAQGAFVVKSFADEDMEALFKSSDMWKSEEK